MGKEKFSPPYPKFGLGVGTGGRHCATMQMPGERKAPCPIEKSFDRQEEKTMNIRRIFAMTTVILVLSMSACFASLYTKDISPSDCARYLSQKKFAIFMKYGSGYRMFEPSSTSGAESDFNQYLPRDRTDLFTSNVACRDYLEEQGWYDTRKETRIEGENVVLFTRWSKSR